MPRDFAVVVFGKHYVVVQDDDGKFVLPSELKVSGGTALKPAWEPIILARKPMTQTVAANVLEHGTGALNIDATRISIDANIDDARLGGQGSWQTDKGLVKNVYQGGYIGREVQSSPLGRWPANLVLAHTEDCKLVGTGTVDSGRSEKPSDCSVEGNTSFDRMRGNRPARGYGVEAVEQWLCVPDCPVRLLDEQSGELPVGKSGNSSMPNEIYGEFAPLNNLRGYADTGGASRFFYTSKASREEREAGLKHFSKKQLYDTDDSQTSHRLQVFSKDGRNDDSSIARNNHPTVKPLDLMRWLCTLVTPPKGLILDPFMGSGTTGCAAVQLGFQFVGIEKEADYVKIADARIKYWSQQPLPSRRTYQLDAKPNEKFKEFFGD